MGDIYGESKTTLDAIDRNSSMRTICPNAVIHFKNVWDIKFEEERVLNDINVNLDVICGGSGGKYIAVYKKSHLQHNSVTIYNHKFEKIGQVNYSFRTEDLYMQYTDDDELVILACSDNMHMLFKYVNFMPVYKLSFETGGRISHAFIWNDGFVCATFDGVIWYSKDFKDPEVFVKLPMSIDAFAVIPPTHTASDEPYIFASNGQVKKLVIATNDKIVSVINVDNFITDIAFSPNYTKVAFFDSDNTISVYTSDLSAEINKCGIEIDDPPSFFGWLDDQLPLICAECSIGVLSEFGEIVYMEEVMDRNPVVFPGPKGTLVYLHQEEKGMSKWELRCMYLISEAMSRVGQDSPVTSLIRAYERRNVMTVKDLALQGGLAEAVEDCVAVAKEPPLTPDEQYFFMSAAAFGRTFLKSRADSYVDTIRALRVANAMRGSLGLFGMASEVEGLLGLPIIPLRFCAAGKHAEAVEVAEYCGADTTPIVTDWCIAVMQRFPDDDRAALKLINTKREENFDSSAIAKAAAMLGRSDLARDIARGEQFPVRVVAFFMQQEMWEEAIRAAAQSVDTVLLLEVVEMALDRAGEDRVVGALAASPEAFYALANMFAADSDNDLAQILKRVPLSPTTAHVTIMKRLELLNLRAADNFVAGLEETKKKLPSKSPEHADHLFDSAERMVQAAHDAMVRLPAEFQEMPPNKAIAEYAFQFGASKTLHYVADNSAAKKSAVMVIARDFARRNHHFGLRELAGETFAPYHKSIAEMINLMRGSEAAAEFVDMAQKGDKIDVAKLPEFGTSSFGFL